MLNTGTNPALREHRTKMCSMLVHSQNLSSLLSKDAMDVCFNYTILDCVKYQCSVFYTLNHWRMWPWYFLLILPSEWIVKHDSNSEVTAQQIPRVWDRGPLLLKMLDVSSGPPVRFQAGRTTIVWHSHRRWGAQCSATVSAVSAVSGASG